MVLKGKNRGRKAKVARAFPPRPDRNGGGRGKVLVEGVNLMKKHQRPRRQGEKGQVIQLAAPISIGNVALFCEHCGRGVRFGVKIIEGKKTRVCRRCGRELP